LTQCHSPSVFFLLPSYSAESIRVTLWGQRAKDFSINTASVVSDEADAKPIVVLFVGCLVKKIKGMHFLPTGMISHFLDTEKGQKII
jgi:hypothetical protein